MSDSRDVSRLLESSRGELLELAQALVRAASENPPGDETAAATVVLESLGSAGHPSVERLEPVPGRVSLLLRFGTGARTLLFCGHLDTVAWGEGWPLEVRHAPVVDGQLWGRGSVDMKGALAAMLLAARAWEQVAGGSGSMLLAFLADEEQGSSRGGALLAERGIAAEAAVVGEPCGIERSFEYVGIASRGVCRFRLHARGDKGHSSLSDRSALRSANLALARALVAMRDELVVEPQHHPRLPDRPTVNAGLWMSGGYEQGSIVPDRASALCEIRTLPGTDREALRRQVEEFVAAHASSSGDSLELEWFETPRAWSEGTDLDAGHPLVGAAQRACRAVLGREVPGGMFPGATDARFLAGRLGIPTIAALGPGRLPLAHSQQEHLAVEELLQAAQIYALTALEYLGS